MVITSPPSSSSTSDANPHCAAGAVAWGLPAARGAPALARAGPRTESTASSPPREAIGFLKLSFYVTPVLRQHIEEAALGRATSTGADAERHQGAAPMNPGPAESYGPVSTHHRSRDRVPHLVGGDRTDRLHPRTQPRGVPGGGRRIQRPALHPGAPATRSKRRRSSTRSSSGTSSTTIRRPRCPRSPGVQEAIGRRRRRSPRCRWTRSRWPGATRRRRRSPSRMGARAVELAGEEAHGDRDRRPRLKVLGQQVARVTTTTAATTSAIHFLRFFFFAFFSCSRASPGRETRQLAVSAARSLRP